MKRTLLTIAIGLVFSTGALAVPVQLQSGPIYFQFNDLEQAGLLGTAYGGKDLNGDGVNDVGPATNEFNWGVFNVSSIQNGGIATLHDDISGGPTYFSDDGPGGTKGQVSGIFYGIELGNAINHATNGYMELYWTEAGADTITSSDLNGGFTYTNRTDWNSAGKFTAGTLLTRLQFASGVIDGDTNTTLSSTQDPLNTSGVGIADGFANVMDINNDGVIDASDGAWATALNGDWFYVDSNNNAIRGEAGETRDFRFSTLFQNLNTWDNGATIQGLRSNDPARSYNVPEPASLALIGLGLLGLGLSRRSRKAA